MKRKMTVLQTLENNNGEKLISDGYFLAMGIAEGEQAINLYAIRVDGFEETNGVCYIKTDAIICSKRCLSPHQDLSQIRAFAGKIMEKEKELSNLRDEAKNLGVSI